MRLERGFKGMDIEAQRIKIRLEAKARSWGEAGRKKVESQERMWQHGGAVGGEIAGRECLNRKCVGRRDL